MLQTSSSFGFHTDLLFNDVRMHRLKNLAKADVPSDVSVCAHTWTAWALAVSSSAGGRRRTTRHDSGRSATVLASQGFFSEVECVTFAGLAARLSDLWDKSWTLLDNGLFSRFCALITD
jgi:hypothetical protein